VSLQEARNKFAAKSFDTSRQDYSESIVSVRRNRQRAQNDRADYEIGALDRNETTLQKFNRLQYEITTFAEEISSRKAKEGQAEEKSASSSSLFKEIKLLQQQLVDLLKEEQTARLIDPKLDVKQQSETVQNVMSEKLLQQISSLVSHANTSGKPDKPQEGAQGSLTYELFYTPQHNKMKELSKAADLEKRIAQLEQLVGQKNTPTNPLSETVAQLKDKIGVISTPENIESLQKSLKVMGQEIDSVLEKKKNFSVVAPAVNEQKINDLYDLTNRWDVTAQQLPSIVQRLQSLRALHEQSASFVNTVAQLESQQEEISSLLKFNNELSTKLDSNFSANMQTIKSNVSSLEARYEELKKRFEAMGLETF